MATVKGVWVFNSSASTGVYPNVAFSQNVIFDWKSSSYSNITYKNTNFDNDYTYAEVSFGNTVVVFLWNDGGQSNVCNTQIDFGETEQPVSDEFYTWLTANATQQASEEEEEPTSGVTITYNGNVIATLEAGQTAALNCAGKVMTSDIVVTAPANGGIRKYSITYDDTDLYETGSYAIIAKPTEIYEGQTIYVVFAHTYVPLLIDAIGCDLTVTDHNIYSSTGGTIPCYVLTISNPTADVTVILKRDPNGSN